MQGGKKASTKRGKKALRPVQKPQKGTRNTASGKKRGGGDDSEKKPLPEGRNPFREGEERATKPLKEKRKKKGLVNYLMEREKSQRKSP